MNIFIDFLERQRARHKRIVRHNVVLFLTPILLVLFAVIAAMGYSVFRHLAHQPVFLLSIYLGIVLLAAFILKIYTIVEAGLFLLWMLVFNGLVVAILAAIIGKYTLFVFPFVLLLAGPLFNQLLEKYTYRKEVESLKSNILGNPQLLEPNFNNQKKFVHAINLQRLDSALIGTKLTQSNKSGTFSLAITDYLSTENSQFIIVDNSQELHIIRFSDDFMQSISVSSGRNSVFLDNQQIIRQLEGLS